MRNLDAGLTPALFEDEDTGKVENFKCRSVLQRELDTRTKRPHFGLKFPPAPLKYVLTSAAPLSLACSDYAVGLKSLLLVVMCPGGGGDCATDAPPFGYNTGVIASTHNNNVEEYMQFLVDHNHNFFVNQSFGKLGFNATIVTVTLDSYLGGQCGSLAENALGYWITGGPDPNYLDVQLNAKVLEDYGKPYLRVHCLQLLVHDGDLFHEHLSTTSPFPPIKASMRWWTLTTRSTPFPIVVPCPGLALDGWGYPVHSFRSRVLLTTRRSLMKSATMYV